MKLRDQRRKNILRNRQGFLSVDFLFAMILAAVMCMLMFAFTTTLSMIEIAQYIAFSTARIHAAAHETPEIQQQLARAKFESYKSARLFPSLSRLLTNDWFDMDSKSLEIKAGGSSGTFNSDYGFEPDRLPQTGVRFRLQAKLLKMNLPFMGSIDRDDEFSTRLTGFIFREPSAKECRDQMTYEARFRTILNLDPRFNRLIGDQRQVDSPQTSYFPLEDNGC